MAEPTNPRDKAFALFLDAFEAWGPGRKFDLAIELADEAVKASLELGPDDETGKKIRLMAVFLQGMAALHATPGPMVRTRS